MTPSKDTLEATNPAGEAALSQPSTCVKQDASRMRADAVSLELPVKVHGSGVKDVVVGTTPHSEPFEEQSSTMIVFAQGGVLKMSTPVAPGQMMVVTNLKSGHDAICRVVQVRAFGQGQSYVEIEFTHRQPGYWGVHFASDKDAAPSLIPPAAPLAPPVSFEVKVEKAEEKPAPTISWAPVSTLKSPLGMPAGQVGRPESAFAPIGSQEEVQPAASATTKVLSTSGRDTDRKGLVAEAARKSLLADLPPIPPSTPTASISMANLQGDASPASGISFAGVPGEAADEPLAEALRTADASAAPFGRLAAGATLSENHAAREPFGSLSVASAESHSAKRRNWLAIAAVVAFLGGATGAAYYLHLPPFAAKGFRSSASEPAPAAAPRAEVVPPASAAVLASLPSVASVQSPAVTAPAAAKTPPGYAHLAEAGPLVTRPAKPSQATSPAAAAPAKQELAATTQTALAAMNAHPTERTHASDSADAAPALDGVGSENGELPALAGSVGVGPPAPAAPQGPVRIRVGGALKPPQLISSVLPVYPSLARDTGIEGDVVIDTTIDTTGKVAAMKVISGPPVLRQSALDALQQWRYAPSLLNGQPIPVEITVTIKFHRS